MFQNICYVIYNLCSRAYKLRHFLRGSGASETESDRSVRQPAVESANDDAAQQTVPLSAVDRLSLNPERGILKNSATNSITRRDGSARDSKSISIACQPDIGVNVDNDCPVNAESCLLDNANRGTANELIDDPTSVELRLNCVEPVNDGVPVKLDEASTANSHSLEKLRQSPHSSCATAIRTSPLPNSICNSSYN
jgi:hypothetical protein